MRLAACSIVMLGLAVACGSDAPATARGEVVYSVTGTACGRTQVGNGVVVGPSLVVTNAHVVAGTDDLRVRTVDGEVVGDVVAFDPGADLALVHVDDLVVAPVGLAADGGGSVEVRHISPAGVTTETPAMVRRRITASGDDIYGVDGARRTALELDVELVAGDSGAGVFDPDGKLVGIVFAVSTGQPSTAYAVASAEILELIDKAGSAAVGVGPCL